MRSSKSCEKGFITKRWKTIVFWHYVSLGAFSKSSPELLSNNNNQKFIVASWKIFSSTGDENSATFLAPTVLHWSKPQSGEMIRSARYISRQETQCDVLMSSGQTSCCVPARATSQSIRFFYFTFNNSAFHKVSKFSRNVKEHLQKEITSLFSDGVLWRVYVFN